VHAFSVLLPLLTETFPVRRRCRRDKSSRGESRRVSGSVRLERDEANRRQHHGARIYYTVRRSVLGWAAPAYPLLSDFAFGRAEETRVYARFTTRHACRRANQRSLSSQVALGTQRRRTKRITQHNAILVPTFDLPTFDLVSLAQSITFSTITKHNHYISYIRQYNTVR
jgi:hypothetical protein